MVTAAQSAPALADLIDALSFNTAAEHINIFTYSAGAVVGSDGLAILGRRLVERGPEKNGALSAKSITPLPTLTSGASSTTSATMQAEADGSRLR